MSLRLLREWKISIQAEWPMIFDARHILIPWETLLASKIVSTSCQKHSFNT